MLQNETTCFAFTYGQEGDTKVSLDMRDPGNWSSGEVGIGTLIGTKFGVSAPVLISWYKENRLGTVTADVMANLSQDVADNIMGVKYWNAMNCPMLPSGPDLSVNDHGFNAGTGTSIRLLQAIVGAGVDGQCGPKTIAAVNAWDPFAYVAKTHISKPALQAVQRAVGLTGNDVDGIWGDQTHGLVSSSGAANGLILSATLYDAQLADYQGMADFATYGHGWTNRCNARLAAAVKLATAGVSSNMTT